MSDEKQEANCVLVVEQQTPSQRTGVENRSSRRAAELQSPRTPRLPSVKSARQHETGKPIDTKPDNEVPIKPIDIKPDIEIPIHPLKTDKNEQDSEKKPPEYEESPKLDAKSAEERTNDKLADLQTHHRNLDLWDEQAGGLSHSASRRSSVSRAMRRVFCCGAPQEREDDRVSTERGK
ncbi:hypothetical protein O0L34_g5926 [Tuta absoluta]|nr:hypothetical protein O0L34_g5926 [Tuta absoluta]